ncbi:MAG: hypothetical protein CMB80_15060 [Flammeovirgaceae bacterium]|nr:hypothetical protein [Flammeovirgaceae bacterium]|tara:strand:- start:304 stop:672 length:369 start_codon:yes stop_codon:yes gene_type:complete
MAISVSDKEFMDIMLDGAAELMLEDAKFIYKGVTKRTPVRSGQTRFSWNVSVDKPNFATLDTGTKILKAKRFPGRITSKVRKGENIRSIHIANGKGHIGYLENGSDTVVAHHMVAATLAGLS